MMDYIQSPPGDLSDDLCQFVLLGPGDVVVNIDTNNNLVMEDLGMEKGCWGVEREEEGRRRDGGSEERGGQERSMKTEGRPPDTFRAKRGRPCSDPPTKEVVRIRRKVKYFKIKFHFTLIWLQK